MNILFYIEPLIELDEPYLKDSWILFCVDIAKTLEKSGNSYDFAIITNEPLGQTTNTSIPISTCTQEELLSPFETTNYLDVTSAWHLSQYTDTQIKKYEKLMHSKLNGFVPDIIVTFSPVPFFKNIFPDTLVLHHEYSIFSRLPYPKSWFLDPVGTHSSPFLNKFESQIKAKGIDKEQKDMLCDFKKSCYDVVYKASPFKDFFELKRKEFDYLVFLPLQFSRYYSFDDLSPFKSQYEYCVYVLDNVPNNIGVVVNTHPEYPVISEKAIRFLKLKYPHFIHDDYFNKIYTSGQFILPFVDCVITVSSSVGLQTLLFDKKLISLGKTFAQFIADSTSLDNIEKTLQTPKKDKDSILYFILTRYAITQKYLHNPKWLDDFLKRSVKKYKDGGVAFDFYSPIDTDDNIFAYLKDTLSKNASLVPVYLDTIIVQKDKEISDLKEQLAKINNSLSYKIIKKVKYKLKTFKEVLKTYFVRGGG